MNRWDGLLLSLVTAILWGVLPVFLQISLQVLNSTSITWIRFLFAAVFVFVYLYFKGKLPKIRGQSSTVLLILLIASLGLVANYLANVKSLEFVNPETVQVVMQISPILLMLGGVVFYKERFNRLELSGAACLLFGLWLFFSPRLGALLTSDNAYNTGVLLVVFAAVSWVGYALLQKVLLRSFTSKQLTLLIYCIGIVVLTPFVELANIINITSVQGFALLFCCLNTVIAYGCFTEALNVWSAAKVSAVVATGPVFTFISVAIAERLLPEQFNMIHLDWVVMLGACCVVIGSMTTALARQKKIVPIKV